MSIIKRECAINWLGKCLREGGWVTCCQALALAAVVFFHWQPTWADVVGVMGLGIFSMGVGAALGGWVIYRNGRPSFDRKKAAETEHATVHYTGAADVVADSVMRQAFREENKKF